MENNKNILVAGATGMIGKKLVQQLLDENYHVTVLTRDKDKAFRIFKNTVDIVNWEESLPQPADAVINLSGASVGEKRWSENYKRKILDSRIESIKNLSQKVKEQPNPPTVWLQASAIGIYGSHPAPGTDETGNSGEGFLSYVVSVWEGTLAKIELNHVRKVYLRFGVVLANEGGFLNEMKSAFNKGIAVCPGSGRQKLSWVHIKDAVNAIIFSLEQTKINGPVNVVSPKHVTLINFTKWLKKYTRALFILKIPGFVFRIIFGQQKADEMILANQEIKPRVLLENKFNYQFENLNDVFNYSE